MMGVFTGEYSRVIDAIPPQPSKFTEVTNGKIAHAQWLLNYRLRKVLGREFPTEAMQKILAEGATIA